MIHLWQAGSGRETLDDAPARWVIPQGTLWIDLLNPTREEELAVERALGLELPTREEMAEIEASSRLYRDAGATFATVDLIHHSDAPVPDLAPVTFVVTDGPLVTIRYAEPRAFQMASEAIERDPAHCDDGLGAFLTLLEAAVDRTADVLETNAERVEILATDIFAEETKTNYSRAISRLGKTQAANGRINASLVSVSRALSFVGLDHHRIRGRDHAERLKTLSRDAQSLIAHTDSVANRIIFQLDAALGLINIEQSSIIKIFSVMAVAFMPPTLVASIYGMNFHHMPELDWPFGYPLAICAMILSAVVPLFWFRKRGWL